MFRACVLALGGVTFLALYKPGIVSENYRLGISTLKVAMADEGHIALDSAQKKSCHQPRSVRKNSQVRTDLFRGS